MLAARAQPRSDPDPRREGKFLARTDGPDGALSDFDISYTFGVAPLQQYLVAFPGGRTQALEVAWDGRPARAGGQRWFHLCPKETIPLLGGLGLVRGVSRAGVRARRLGDVRPRRR